MHSKAEYNNTKDFTDALKTVVRYLSTFLKFAKSELPQALLSTGRPGCVSIGTDHILYDKNSSLSCIEKFEND